MIGAAIRKDLALLVRDRGALVSLFALPVVFILVFGSTLHFGPDRGSPRAIAIWHAPGDARGEAIARTLAATPGFAAHHGSTPEAVRDAVATEHVGAGLVVPEAAQEPVELVLDLGTPIYVRAPIEGALTGVVARAATTATAWLPLVAVRSPPGAGDPLANITSFQVAVPGNAELFGFFIALTVALAFASERRSGTWRRALASPVPRWKLLVATLVPYYVIGVVQLAFLFAVGIVAFDLQIAGSSTGLVAISLAVTLCAVALGLAFASVATNEKQLGGIGSVLLLVMGTIGGCMVPRIVMPELMQQIGLAVPHGWALDAYYAVLVRQSTTLADVLPEIAALLAFGALFAAFGLSRFRFE